jgi:flagellar biogenesis protein FliO
MRWIAGTIGLLLLSTYPVGLSAQVVPYSVPAAPNGNVAPAAYQQPVAPQTSVNAENQFAPTSPAGAAASPDAVPSLSPPKLRSSTAQTEPAKAPGGIQSVATVGGSLAVVLGIFFLVVWVLRRAAPQGFGTLPGEVFEVLGRAALANRQQVHLLRCGNKLLLVCVTATGTGTLSEITDPAEVDRLAGLCRQARSNGAATAFRQVFRQVEKSDA